MKTPGAAILHLLTCLLMTVYSLPILAQDVPAQDASAQESSAQESSAQESSAQESSAQGAPAKDGVPAEFQPDQEINFDTDFEGFDDGDFGAPESTPEEDAAFKNIVIVMSIVGIVLVGVVALLIRRKYLGRKVQ